MADFQVQLLGFGFMDRYRKHVKTAFEGATLD